MKGNAGLFCLIAYVMLMYFTVMAYMFDPTDTAAMSSMLELLPKGLMSAFGFDSVSTNLTSFMADYYYGFLVFVFPMIYSIVTANRLVARMVDNGSFAYLLMAPVPRRTIIITKGIYLLTSIGVLFVILHLAGGMVCRILFGSMLNQEVFLRLNINAALLAMFVGMICFFYSCYFNESRLSLSFSSGVTIGFLLLFMMGGVSPDAEFLKDLSIFSLLDTRQILDGGGTVGLELLLIMMILILFGLSIWVFDRKNLPI